MNDSNKIAEGPCAEITAQMLLVKGGCIYLESAGVVCKNGENLNT